MGKNRMAVPWEQAEWLESAREWIRETKTGKKRYGKLLTAAERHPIEKVGARLRGLMAWREKDS